MVSVSMECLGLDGPTWTEKVTATIRGMRSAHHAKMVSKELADWAKDMKYDDTEDGAFDEVKDLFADKFEHVNQMIKEGLDGVTLAGVKNIFVSEAFILEAPPGEIAAATGSPSSCGRRAWSERCRSRSATATGPPPRLHPVPVHDVLVPRPAAAVLPPGRTPATTTPSSPSASVSR